MTQALIILLNLEANTVLAQWACKENIIKWIIFEGLKFSKRKGKGVKTLNVTEKTGKIVAIKSVHEDDDLLISTSEGIMIRLAVSDMRVSGRATQGVKIIKLDDNDSIGDIAVVKNTDEEVSNEEISTEVIIPIIEDDITHIQNLTEEE